MRLPVILLISVVLGVIIFQASTYVLPEWEQVIITQFGEPIGDAVTEPGLHFKVPFIQKVERFEKRWLEWDGEESEMPTKEKTYIYVDTYARWRIIDPLKFFISVHDEASAQSRLDDIIDSETRNVIAAHHLIEVVRSSNREFQQALDLQVAKVAGAEEEEMVKIKVGRDKLTRLILEKSAKAMPEFGIELVDIQFQRVNYTRSVKTKVFERMIQDRKSIANAYRSEGEGEAARIRGDKARELKTIESGAFKDAEIIKGTADATATDIYAEAYNRDPAFYKLIRSLESYSKTIDEDSVVVLSSESDYFKTLVDPKLR